VRRHGKQSIGWGDIAPARLLPGTVIQYWRPDSTAQAVARGTRVVLSPSNRAYIDMKYDSATVLGLSWAGLIPVRHAYDWEPATVVAGIPEAAILGVEAPLWSETIANLTAAYYLAFPRLPALAEVGWTPQAGRDWESFRTRIAGHAPRWNLMGINYYRSPQVAW